MSSALPGNAGPARSVEAEPVVEVSFRPQGRNPSLPVEVFDRGELVSRIPTSRRGRRHRTHFHLLLICFGGSGTHVVDFVEYALTPGTAIRIRPGQTYEYVDLDHGLSMFTVIWRVEHHIEETGRPSWFPGGPDPTQFVLEPEILARAIVWVGELRAEQDRFDGSSRRIDLMRTILRGLLMLIDDASGEPPTVELPAAYLELRELLERELYERPSVQHLSRQLGYSSRTLDRACQSVTGQTARQVVDDRIRLELRRLLADESISIGQVRRVFGFDEATNFTKFVRRIVGQSPGEFRSSFSS